MKNRKKRRYRSAAVCLLAAALILSAGSGVPVLAETEQTEPANVTETDNTGETPGSEPETGTEITEPGTETTPEVQIQSVPPAQNQILEVPAETVDEAVQSVQDQIDALPADTELAGMRLEEQQAVYEQVMAAYDAYAALTDEQRAQVTGAEKFDNLFAVFNGMVNTLADNTDVSSGPVTITTDGTYTITGTTTTNTITVNSGVTATITLNNVTIDRSSTTGTAFDIQSGANVTLNLVGTNTLTGGGYDDFNGVMAAPGIHLPSGASLTIQGTGSLTVTGGNGGSSGFGGAGIGGNSRTVTSAAEACGTITILSGTVEVKGGSGGLGGVGIGGGTSYSSGSGGAGGNVTIKGGSVTITGGISSGIGAGGTGIGGGAGFNSANGGAGGTVIITGGTVTVTGGNGGYGGAGIGGGASGSAGGAGGTVIILTSVNVTGGTGTGTGGIDDGINIGGGQGSSSGGDGTVGAGIRPNTSSGNNAYEVYGDLTLPGSVTIPGGVTVTVPSGISLTIPDGVTLTNNGTLTVNGTLTNSGAISGTGTISPETAKLQASITNISVSKTEYNGNPVQNSEVSYRYTGDPNTPTITIAWYDSNADGTIGSSRETAPSDPGTYYVEVSALATGLYGSVTARQSFTIGKGQRTQPSAPETDSVKAGSITIKTIAGQKYICTTTSTAPAATDEGWQPENGTAGSETLTFNDLRSNTTYYIWTYIPQDDLYNASAVSQPLQVTTNGVTYTVTIPAQTLTAGDESSTVTVGIDQTKDFDIGYGGVVTVSAPASVTLTRTGDPGTSLTSALLVRDSSGTYTAHSGNTLISFDQSNYQSQSAEIRFGQPALDGGGAIPAGSYTGTMTFTFSYSETGSSS
ncbi:carbohydrate-binding domain-containing protein [Lachnoclostridium sp. An169]|uniref:carbohydrate-binding domain-containing protein n=1 Tax=Lachnoclostridium sp. An169 TaxID=1965569 RepID=UPI000B376B88|nr:carbohydrate-binding domain-containing protein [Lachnoclostridium sp. An169]